MKAASLAMLLLTLCLTSAAQQSDFTIVVLPDTQNYSALFPQIFSAQTQWIRDHVATDNIQLVVGLGDIVNAGGNLQQWENAGAAADLLDGAVPYLFAIGNHDYDKGDKAPLKRLAANFNAYFGPSRYAGYGYYGGSFLGSNENFYGIVTLGGKDTLILVLEFTPRDAAINWAKSTIAMHPDKDVIIVTHSFGYRDGQISTCDGDASETFGLNDDNDGQDLWTKLISQKSNITMVLSGHVTAYNGVGRRVDYGVNGNRVTEILSDYQAYANGGDGYLRIMRFHPSQNRVDVETYSPTLNARLTDDANQFSMPLRGRPVGAPASLSGTITDKATCMPLAGVTVKAGSASALTDKYGNYVITGLSPTTNVTVTASKAGYVNQSRSTPLMGGSAATMKMSLSLK
jgi:hypothetical protein